MFTFSGSSGRRESSAAPSSSQSMELDDNNANINMINNVSTQAFRALSEPNTFRVVEKSTKRNRSGNHVGQCSAGSNPIATRNRYEVLADAPQSDNMGHPPRSAQQAAQNSAAARLTNIHEKPSPFYVRDPRVVEALDNHMSQLQISNYAITIRRLGQEAKLQVATVEEYRKVQKAFNEKKIPFFTFQLKSERSLKVVIKGIPPSTNPDKVKDDLGKAGFKPRSVQTMLNYKGQKCCMVLVEIDVDPTANIKTHPIYNLNRFNNHVITVEEPHKRTFPTQCYNCQEYFHTKNRCNLPSICAICAKNHRTDACPHDKNDSTVKKCINCGENHTANYKGCVVYQRFREKLNPRQRRKQQSANREHRSIRQSAGGRRTARQHVNDEVQTGRNQSRSQQETHPTPGRSDAASYVETLRTGTKHKQQSFAQRPKHQEDNTVDEELTVKDVLKTVLAMQMTISSLQSDLAKMITKQNSLEECVKSLLETVKPLIKP